MKKVRLGDYIEQIRGVSYKPTDLTSELGNTSISLLRANNISNGIIVPNELQYIKRAKVSQNQVLRVNDILMCTSSGSVAHVGKIALMTSHDEYTFGAFCKVIRTMHELSPQYVALFLSAQSTRRCIEHNAKGANINNLRNEDIDNLTIPYCSREIQQKICQRISAVKRFIHKRQMQLEKLDELVKARFIEMFGDMSTNPNHWEPSTLGKACDVRDGTHDSPKYYDAGYPLITSKNVTGGQITFSDCNFISEYDYRKISIRSKVDYGDILMPMIGTIGTPVIVQTETKFAIKNVALIKFPASAKLINTFVYHFLQSAYFESIISSKSRGGTQKFLSLSDIRNINLFIPPAERQNTFAAFAEQVEKSKATIQKSLEKAQQLYDSLLQEYFA